MATDFSTDDATYQRPYNPDWQQQVQTLAPAGSQQQQLSPQAPAAPTGQSGNPFYTGMPSDQARTAIQQYYDSRGVTPRSTSVDYWTGKWGEFGNKDPEYFQRFLSNAEEFTGGPQQTAQAMWGGGGGGSSAYMPGVGLPGMGSALGGVWGGRANSLYDLLMQRAGQSLNIDRSNPVIRNQSDAYSAMQQRAMRNYLGDVAERQGANANISAERRAAAEKVAQSTSGFEAQLMGQELAARRAEIQQALAGMGGLLTEQQRMALQEELGQLGLAQQAYQFDQQQQFAMSPFGSAY